MTFEKADAAEQAVSDHNGSMVQGIQLKVIIYHETSYLYEIISFNFPKVEMARRQTVVEPINDATSSSTWSAIAASHSLKGSHKDKRNLVTYEEDIF